MTIKQHYNQSNIFKTKIPSKLTNKHQTTQNKATTKVTHHKQNKYNCGRQTTNTKNKIKDTTSKPTATNKPQALKDKPLQIYKRKTTNINNTNHNLKELATLLPVSDQHNHK